MRYPRYRPDQDLRRKVSLAQIFKIHRLYNAGLTQREIGEMFGLTQSGVWYILISDGLRKIKNQKNYQLRKKRGCKQPAEQRREIRKRKRKLLLTESREYNREWMRRKRMEKIPPKKLIRKVKKAISREIERQKKKTKSNITLK